MIGTTTKTTIQTSPSTLPRTGDERLAPSTSEPDLSIRRPRRRRLFVGILVGAVVLAILGAALGARAALTGSHSPLSVVEEPLDVVPGVTDPHAGPRSYRPVAADGSDTLAAKRVASLRTSSTTMASTGGAALARDVPAARQDRDELAAVRAAVRRAG